MKVFEEIRSGAAYTFIFRYLGIFIQILTTSILARLLTPNEFGVYVAVFVIIYFFQLLSDSGIAASIIQRENINNSEIFSLFIVSISVGLLLAGFFISIGPLIASFYRNLEYKKIVPLLSISLFFYTAHLVPWAILYREKRFKTIGIITITVQLLPAVLGIILAFNNFGYYSLVYQSIFQSVLKFIIVLFISPIKLGARDFSIVRKIFKYSMFKSLADIMNYLTRNLDNILIGRVIGMEALGYYDKAYKLMLLPIGSIAEVVSQVLHPVLAKYQTNISIINNVYLKLTKYFGLIGISLSVYLFFSAKEIIYIIFGSQWFNSVLPFKYMTQMIWIQMILSTSQPIFLSIGRSNYLFITGLIASILIATGICIGTFLFKSIVSVAIMILLANSIVFILITYIMNIMILKNRIIDFFLTLKAGVITGIVLLIINIVIYFEFNTGNLIIDFSIKLFFSAIFFLITLYKLDEIKGLLSFFKKKIT